MCYYELLIAPNFNASLCIFWIYFEILCFYKVVCALASGTPIVSVKYFEDLLDCCDKKNVNKLPLETK